MHPGAQVGSSTVGAQMKGKCALGPFLSILVIECQHKCFCVNLCKVVDKVQIMSKGMFLDLVHCLWTNVLCLSAGNRKNRIGEEMAKVSQGQRSLGAPDCPVVHRTVSGGAPDSVRCAGLALANLLLSGVRQRCTTIIHRTVWWCTGLSGEPCTDELVALGR
jgi:hypothetical protein